MQVGRVLDAARELLVEEDPTISVDDVVIPLVAECDDSDLNDSRRTQVSKDDVRAALAAARASAGSGEAPAEGAVGAGTGMTCLGYKGGIGTSSRVVPSGHTAGGRAVGRGVARVARRAEASDDPPRRARQRLRGRRRVGERYTGSVSLDTVTWEQRAEAGADFTVRWPEATVRARADVTLVADRDCFDLMVDLQTWRDGEPFAARQWHRRIPRDLG